MSGDKIILAVTVLLTGFAVVFLVLLLLIGIIKLYGTIIYSLQKKNKQREKTKVLENIHSDDPAPAVAAPQPAPAVQGDDELIAVIAAAVYAMCGSSEVRIRSIRKSAPSRSAWRNAGLSEHIRPF